MEWKLAIILALLFFKGSEKGILESSRIELTISIYMFLIVFILNFTFHFGFGAVLLTLKCSR